MSDVHRSSIFDIQSSTPLHRVFLSLGSNIEPERYLPLAVRELSQLGRIIAVSSVWESAAVGDADQPNYLNAAVFLKTPLCAAELCRQAIPRIESQLGRSRDPANKHAPRTIDIDLVLFNNETLTIDHRQIPDPQISERPFLAIPLAEIAPEYRHPVTGQTLAAIATGWSEISAGLMPRANVDLRQA